MRCCNVACTAWRGSRRVISTSTGCLGQGSRKEFSNPLVVVRASSVLSHSWKSEENDVR